MPEPQPSIEPQPYGRIVGRNISAARGQLQATQTAVARRMSALKFDWHQQTVANVEKGKRRITAEEIFALAWVLDTPVEALLTPAANERGYVKLGDGEVHVVHARTRMRSVSDGAVGWDDDDKPDFLVNHAGWGGPPGARTVADILHSAAEET